MARVVITGAGTVNPLGADIASTKAALAEGRSAIGPLDFRDVERLSVGIGAQIRGWQPETLFDRQELAFYDPFTQYAVHAARQAMEQSGLTMEGELADTSGVVIGSAGGGVNTWDDSYRAVYEEGKNRVHPFVIPRLMNSAAASHISMKWNLRGPALTVSTACASSNQAMGLAFGMVRSGAAKVMLTGGSDAMMCFGGIKSWEGLRVMSKTGCRPFSADRDGMVHGEGAAVFVFEEYEHARARGAAILAEVAGYATTSDAADIVLPSAEGAERAIRGALRDAGLDPGDVGYVNAHGTGTAANDRTECAAIRNAFGPAADRLMVSSTKSMHGHLIGGTGAVELIACLMALQDGIIAPTAGHTSPDPDCALDVVPNVAREAKVSAVLSNAFAFGGLNAVLALRRA